MLLALLTTTLAFGLIALPGVVALAFIDRRTSWAAIASLGSSLGLAVAALAGWHALRFGLPFPAVVAGEWIAASLIAATVVLLRRRDRGVDPGPRAASAAGLPLLALLALVFASRAVPSCWADLPLGTDPSFHCLLAEKILLTRALPADWMPFEPVAVNYPLGTHLLVAEIARATALPVTRVFQGAFPVVAALSALAVHALTLRLLGRAGLRAAPLAALAFGFLAGWGSLDAYRWGGLPNALGTLLLLGAAQACWHDRPGLARGAFALLFASLVVVHHHAALCAGILFAGYAAFVIIISRGLPGSARRIAAGLAGATLLAALPLLSYLRGGAEVGRTSVLRFYEPLVTIWDGLGQLGWPLVALSAAGLALVARFKGQPGDDDAPAEPLLFLASWTVLMLGAFVLFGQVWRFAALALDGGFYAAFTPTRFLTQLAGPLSIAAGVGLARAAEVARSASLRRLLAVMMTLAAVLSAVPALRAQCVDPGVPAEALRWIAAHAEVDALVVAESPWASYLCWRETVYTPLPASEAREDERVRHKRETLARDATELRRFTTTTGRPAYIVLDASRALEGLAEVYFDGRTRVFKLD